MPIYHRTSTVNNKAVNRLSSAIQQALLGLTNGKQSIKVDYTHKDFLDNPTFDAWLSLNKNRIIREFSKDFDKVVKSKQDNTNLKDKLNKLISESILSDLSRKHMIVFYEKFYQKDLGAYAERNPFIVYSVLNKLLKVKDLKFNHYVCEQLRKKIEVLFLEKEDYKQIAITLEKHTLKVELERQLKSKASTDKKINKI